MNTQAQVRKLEAGQALQLSGRSVGPAILTEGELLVQGPARWLADTIVFPAPVRLVAPAVLEAAAGGSIVAVRASKVVLQQAAPRLSTAQPPAFAGRMRVLLRRWGLRAGGKAQGQFAS